MNRRVVLIDQEETPNYYLYFRGNLGDEVYLLKSLEDMEETARLELLRFGPGDGIMLVGSKPFTFLNNYYHFGIRGENYFDCSKLRRLSIEGGAYVKVVLDYPEPEEIADFFNPEFTRDTDFSWFKQKVLHTFSEAISLLDYMDSLPLDTNYGFDYEASGMPLDKWFELSGASLCNSMFGGFISFTDIRHEVGANSPQYQHLLNRLGAFLVKRQDHIWTYNMQYEFQVSHRMLGVDLYNLCDASVFNVLDGNHEKKYSLKWTGNKILQSKVWDTEFDYISELIDKMLFTEVGKLKKDKHQVLKVDQESYKKTPEWAELCKRYPAYIGEFEKLILEYWGNPFMCIPSDILGLYCNLDAFMTLQIYEARKDMYSKTAIDTFLDNIRLAARLHSCGIPKLKEAEEYRTNYEAFLKGSMAWGITYCAEARCKIKIDKHTTTAANISSYPEVTQRLLNKGAFITKDILDKAKRAKKLPDTKPELLEFWKKEITLELTKYLMINNLDPDWETGIDEGKLVMSYGNNFAETFMKIVKEARESIKMKDKIDDSVVRKKKLLGLVADQLRGLLGIERIKNLNKHMELEKLLYYQKAYTELMKVSKKQLNNVNNIPTTVYAFGKRMNIDDYANYVSDNYFKCKSPEENDAICLELAELYKPQSAYLAAMSGSIQQLEGTDHFYSNRGIDTIEKGFEDFMKWWEDVVKTGQNNSPYPNKVFSLALDYYRNPGCEDVKKVWSDFDGYATQSTLFKYVDDQYLDYGKIFNEADLKEDLYFMRKLTLNYLYFKKSAKCLSVYIGYEDAEGTKYGMFKKTDMWVIENPENHVMIREAEPNEPGAIIKMKPKFQCMEKSSKRWSSGYHTIVSHSDIKSTIGSYPGCLLSYFDISSAEVKSAGYMAGDMAIQRHGPNAPTNLIDTFNNGIDVYIKSCKTYLGEEGWNNLSPKDQKIWRKRFKTITLGILYGLGVASLSEKLNTTQEEALKITKAMFNMYPELEEYIKSQQQYPFEHDGCINTFFGDRLQVNEWKFYNKAKTSGERRSLEARIKRLAVNLPIQGGTSTAMSSGFFNDLRVAKEQGWNLTSFITVHDSNTCNFPATRLWEIRKFYDTNFTDFCYESTGIKLLFDIEIGSTYQDSCSATQISDDIVELKGNARSLQMIIDKLNECPDLKYEISMNREDIQPNYVTDSLQRFIIERGCSFVMDTSKYKVQFKKL